MALGAEQKALLQKIVGSLGPARAPGWGALAKGQGGVSREAWEAVQKEEGRDLKTGWTCIGKAGWVESPKLGARRGRRKSAFILRGRLWKKGGGGDIFWGGVAPPITAVAGPGVYDKENKRGACSLAIMHRWTKSTGLLRARKEPRRGAAAGQTVTSGQAQRRLGRPIVVTLPRPQLSPVHRPLIGPAYLQSPEGPDGEDQTWILSRRMCRLGRDDADETLSAVCYALRMDGWVGLACEEVVVCS